MENIRYFVDLSGYLHEVWQCPCGCCPFDVAYKNDRHHENRGIYRNGVSLSFSNQRQINKWIKNHGWVELK